MPSCSAMPRSRCSVWSTGRPARCWGRRAGGTTRRATPRRRALLSPIRWTLRAYSLCFASVCRYTKRRGAQMATAFASEAAHIAEIGNLTVPDISRATGAHETTVRAWLRDERSPSGEHAERLAELSAMVERLVRVMEATYIPVWMRKPIALLDDDKPLDVIAVGDYRRVSRVVAGLEASAAV